MKYSRQYNKELAAVYAEQASLRAQEDLGRAFLRRRLSSQDRAAALLDMGCGSGIDLIAYRQMGFSKCVGLDASPHALERAKQALGAEARLICGGFERLPFAAQSMDGMTARFSLMYGERVEDSFAEAARVLKPGGLFAAVVSHPLRDARLPRGQDGTVTVIFFNGAVTTTYPAHAMNDYLGSSFQKYFENIACEEISDRESAGYVQEEILAAPADEPTVLCFSGVRRALIEARR